MEKKDVIEVNLPKLDKPKEKKEEQHRCEYCHKTFTYPPIIVFMKPSQKYKLAKGYPAFELCSDACKDRLMKQEGWIEFNPEERKEVSEYELVMSKFDEFTIQLKRKASPLEKYAFLVTQVIPYINNYKEIITQFKNPFEKIIEMLNAI